MVPVPNLYMHSLEYFGDLLWAFLADFLHTASKISSDLKKLMSYIEKRIILWS